MEYKGVIFDLDGTLVNSLEDIADSMNFVLLNNHFPTHSLSDYKSFIGKGILNLVLVSLPENNRDAQTVSTCHLQMMEHYRYNCTNKTLPYEGIVDMLTELKARRMKLSVFSNKTDELTKKIVQKVMPDYFETVVGLTNENMKKPNPHMALQISNHMGIAPKNMIYIGDTGIDMETAKNAGMCSIGVVWGFRPREELIDSGANEILNHPMDLIKYL